LQEVLVVGLRDVGHAVDAGVELDREAGGRIQRRSGDAALREFHRVRPHEVAPRAEARRHRAPVLAENAAEEAVHRVGEGRREVQLVAADVDVGVTTEEVRGRVDQHLDGLRLVVEVS
ncbi:MAG: hypothetical protein ACK55I_32355, partial [bacterium]